LAIGGIWEDIQVGAGLFDKCLCAFDDVVYAAQVTQQSDGAFYVIFVCLRIAEDVQQLFALGRSGSVIGLSSDRRCCGLTAPPSD